MNGGLLCTPVCVVCVLCWSRTVNGGLLCTPVCVVCVVQQWGGQTGDNRSVDLRTTSCCLLVV